MNPIEEVELHLHILHGDVANLLRLFRHAPAVVLEARRLLFALTEREPIRQEGAVRTLYAAFELYNDGDRDSMLVS